MGKTKTMLFALAGILFLTCDKQVDLQEEIIFQEETSAEPVPVEKNDRVKTVSYDQIPDVVDNLLGRFDKTSKGIRDGKLPLEDAILNLEKIKEVVNAGQNTNYTFALDVADRPDHIYNLILTKLPDGTVVNPMVIGYRMEPADMEAFFKSGEDYSLFKSEFRYYKFDNFFNGSKGYSVGKEEDCGGGTSPGTGGSSSPTAPGETFTHTYGGHTVTNIFGNNAIPHSYGYSVSIRTQNAQVSTVSTVGTSGTVQISTPGPTGTLISHNVAPGTNSIGVTNNAGTASPESSCFTITEVGDGAILITYHPCGGNAPQQKGPTTSKEGDCGSPDGTFAVNTAAKAIAKLDYHLPGGLTGGQLAWFSDSDHPDRKYIAYDLVWHLLDNNKSVESVSFVLFAIDLLLKGAVTDMDEAYLNYILVDNPFLLLEIDCDQIQKWQALAQHTAPLSVQNKINNLQQNHDGPFGDWEIQQLKDANGTIVNLDYFSVNITQFPTNPSTGQPFTPTQFIDYFRRNIDGFVNNTTFEPYCEISAICQQETDLWNSNNPLGAVVKLDISLYNGPGGNILSNDGVVVCADFNGNYWRFMTLEAPYDSNHPVSGTRQFGIEQMANGSYNIYVRGVDRFNSRIQEASINLFTDPFTFADNLWESFQDKTNDFINSNGGSSGINIPVLNRPDWEKVQDVLQGNRPISDLGCD